MNYIEKLEDLHRARFLIYRASLSHSSDTVMPGEIDSILQELELLIEQIESNYA